MRRSVVVAAVLLVACSGAGIGGQQPAESGVRTYIKALRSDNPRAAYEMFTSATRRQLSYAEFQVIWREHKGERLEQAKSLEEGLKEGSDLGETARVRYSDGKTVNMSRESGDWKLESGLVARGHASRPIDAVRILAESVAARDFDALMRILTARRRNGISREVDEFTSSLIESLDHEVSQIGPDRAELIWETDSARYKIVLRKEADEWRVDDLHIRPKEAGP
jgi:hypothetical protein